MVRVLPACELIGPEVIGHEYHPSSDSSHGPLVTIAIPTFNRATFLRGCLRTVLAQTYQRFEVVVSDNSSTDDTSAVLDEIKDRRLRVVRQRENIGPTANWNACLAEAKGSYIVFVPDDDRISPWMLERCVDLVGREPQIPIIMALGDCYLAAEDRTLRALASRQLGTGVWDGVDILLEYLKGRISVQGCTVMLRTEALRASGGFPTDWPFAGDLARQLPLLLVGRAGLVNECCGTYCDHSATTTSNLALESHITDLRKLADLIIGTAHHYIKDAQRCRDIELYTRRFAAFNVIGIIASHRKRGTKLAEVFPVIWRWRRDLSHLGLANVFKLPRALALLFFPGLIIRRLRRFKRILSSSVKNSENPLQNWS